MKKSQSLPIKGKTYYYFDDGKITKSRRGEVVITEIIPFEEIDDNTKKEWGNITQELHLFDSSTDFFIKGVIKDYNQELIFVKSKGGWFSFNNYLWDGRLDVDGSLNSRILI